MCVHCSYIAIIIAISSILLFFFLMFALNLKYSRLPYIDYQNLNMTGS